VLDNRLWRWCISRLFVLDNTLFTFFMALKIRLSRIGAVHKPIYHIVVAEARSRRDGAPAEVLGTYTPQSKKEPLILDVARADYWLSKGALPTDTAHSLIKKARKAAPAETPAV
jgi:small subunit ribosomal protein S16